MGPRKVRELLRQLVSSRKKVQLTRTHPGEPRCNGFVLGLSEDWVLVNQFHDFASEGYTILRVNDICGVRSGEYERKWESMLASEGTLDQVGITYEVGLQNIRSILESLHGLERNIIVECEDQDDSDEDEFYIGRIVKVVEDDHLQFKHFDALGRWEEDVVELPLSRITKVQFDTPYIITFSKYVPEIRP